MKSRRNRKVYSIFCYLYLMIFLHNVGCLTLEMNTSNINVAINKNICQKNIKTIATFPFDQTAYSGFDAGPSADENIADQYSAELINMGYNLIERTKLKKLFVEQGLQYTGAVDIDKATKLGKLLGADALLFGTTAGKPGQWSVSVRLISVEKGIIIWTLNSRTPAFPKQMIKSLKMKMEDHLKNEKSCK